MARYRPAAEAAADIGIGGTRTTRLRAEPISTHVRRLPTGTHSAFLFGGRLAQPHCTHALCAKTPRITRAVERSAIHPRTSPSSPTDQTADGVQCSRQQPNRSWVVVVSAWTRDLLQTRSLNGAHDRVTSSSRRVVASRPVGCQTYSTFSLIRDNLASRPVRRLRWPRPDGQTFFRTTTN